MIKIAVLGSYFYQKFMNEIEAEGMFDNVQLSYINTWGITDYTLIPKMLESTDYNALIMGPIDYSHYANVVQIPCYVVSPSVSDFLLLHKMIKDYENTAVVFHVPDDLDFSLLEDCLHVRYHKFYYHELEELDTLLPVLREKGIHTIIGNYFVIKRAQYYGMTGYYYYSRNDIEAAIHNALQFVTNLEQEKKHRLEIRAVLENSICGAIYASGPEMKISYVNQTALSMLQKKREDLLLKPLNNFIPDEMAGMLSRYPESGNERTFSLCGTDVIGNLVALQTQDDVPNLCLLFENASRVIKYESLIRKEMKKKNFQTHYSFKNIVGSNTSLKKAIVQAKRFAESTSTILINAETGSGKEVFAQSIHNYSSRHSYPFVAINCASIPDSLIESELFGYEAGAFTGASSKGKSGLIELANHGTVFLDDVDSLPPGFQAKLLRVMQEREVIRIGGNSPIPVDVRFIAATNRNLKEMVSKGKFRNDLYYRINVLHLYIPPLRDRAGDIPVLMEYYLRLHSEELWKQISPHFNETFEPAFSYSYPGNIRELVNIVERFVSLVSYNELEDIRYLKQLVIECLDLDQMDEVEVIDMKEQKKENKLVFSGNYEKDILNAERSVFQHYLSQHQGNMTSLAKELKISRTTLYKKIKELDLQQEIEM